MVRTVLMAGLMVAVLAFSAPASVTFLAHYDTTTNADVAAGNAADLGGGKGTIVTGGKFGSGAHFGTSNQASVYATAGNIQADSGTLMFWYKADTANLDWPCLFSIGTTSYWANPPQTDLMIRSLPGYNSTYVYMTDASGHSYSMNPTGVGGTSWAHVAVTWSASGGTCDFKAYSNGSLTASQTGVTWSSTSIRPCSSAASAIGPGPAPTESWTTSPSSIPP